MFVTSKMSNNMHNMLQTTEEVTSDLQVSQVSVTQPTQTGLNRHNPGGGGGGTGCEVILIHTQSSGNGNVEGLIT